MPTLDQIRQRLRATAEVIRRADQALNMAEKIRDNPEKVKKVIRAATVAVKERFEREFNFNGD